MTIYDGLMALIVVYTVIHGFWRGASWQIAPIVSLVAGYMIAMPMSVTAAHWFGQPPLNRLFALVTIYILVSLTVYLFFRSFREGVEKAQLTEFDRHLGAILGGLKGVIFTLSTTCVLLIYFPLSREIILKSESSTIVSKLISKIYPILPQAMHKILDPYLNKLDDQLRIDFDQAAGHDDGFERSHTSNRRQTSGTLGNQPQQTFDENDFRHNPTAHDDRFDSQNRRDFIQNRAPIPHVADSYDPPARRERYLPPDSGESPTASRSDRRIERSAEEDDPFEIADPDKATRKKR